MTNSNRLAATRISRAVCYMAWLQSNQEVLTPITAVVWEANSLIIARFARQPNYTKLYQNSCCTCIANKCNKLLRLYPRDGIIYAIEIGQNSEIGAGRVTPDNSKTLDCLLLLLAKGMPTERPAKPPFVSKNLFIINERHFFSQGFVEHFYLLAFHDFIFRKLNKRNTVFTRNLHDI